MRSIAVLWCLLLALATPTLAHAQSLQALPASYLSAASTNATLISGAGQNVLKSVIAINTTATIYYLKLYNKASVPVCGTDVPVLRIPLLPANNTGGGLSAISLDDMRFTLGIGFCLTGALADNDTTVAATGIALNFGYLWQ